MKEEVQYVYYVLVMDVTKLTDENHRKNYEIHKIKYNKPELTFDDYLKFIKDWGEYKYSIGDFISSYHLTMDEAKEYIEKNICDINEAGCYNYAAAVAAPVGCAYYNVNQNPNEDIALYKYNHGKYEYLPFKKEDDEDLYQHLLYHAWGMHLSDNN